jgi:hypothetical protein
VNLEAVLIGNERQQILGLIFKSNLEICKSKTRPHEAKRRLQRKKSPKGSSTKAHTNSQILPVSSDKNWGSHYYR